MRLTAVFGLALLASVSAAAQQAKVVNAGSEQALNVDGTTISRPFGASLVDAIRVIGKFRLAGEPLWLVEGRGDATCPFRYVVVVRRSAEEIVASEPFGACGPVRRAYVTGGQLVIPTVTATQGTAPLRFGYASGRVRLIDAPAARVAVAAAPLPADCHPASDVSPDEQAAVIADFERSFPREYQSFSALRRADLTQDALRTLVTGLACLSTWPSANDVVLKRSTRLFVSKRWGQPAFAALDAVARDPSSGVNVIAATKSFSAEMSYRAAAWEPPL